MSRGLRGLKMVEDELFEYKVKEEIQRGRFLTVDLLSFAARNAGKEWLADELDELIFRLDRKL